MLDRPHNLEAERCVIGAMLFGESVDLKAEHLYHETHQWLFKAIHDLREKQQPVDAVTVRARATELAGRNIEPYTMHLVLETTPHTAHASHYAEIVYKCWERRTAVKVAEWIYQQATDPSSDMDAVRKRVGNWAAKGRTNQ